MTPPNIDNTPHDTTELAAHAPGEDTFFGQLDDEELERALKTVSCNPRDMRQFLRSGALR